jgi:SAM-dependent methyltransferase
MKALRAHDWRWKADGGYYFRSVAELQENPLLPDFRKVRDCKIAALFDRYLPRTEHPDVMELGCGASRWLPYLAIYKDCRVVGLDYEMLAVDLTLANMGGAGAHGSVLCRDAFDTTANTDLFERFDLVYSFGLLEHFDDVVQRIRAVVRYLRPGGILMTMVPNLQGLNWLLQRYGDRRILETHVVYTVADLRHRHEEAALDTLTAGYAGFYDGFLSATAPTTPRLRRRAHRAICRATNLTAWALLKLTRNHFAPELVWTAPAIYYLGRRR